MFILINSTGYVITCRCPIPPSWTILVFCKIITISWWLFDFWFLIHNRLLVKRERVTDTEEILGYRITVGRLYWWGRGRFWIVAGAGRTSTGEYGIQQHWDIHVVVLQVAKYFLHVLYKQDSTYTVLCGVLKFSHHAIVLYEIMSCLWKMPYCSFVQLYSHPQFVYTLIWFYFLTLFLEWVISCILCTSV